MGGGCPTTLYELGNDALHYWVGRGSDALEYWVAGGITPYNTDR